MKPLAPAGVDPYARGFLADPWRAYQRLHQAGPVLWHEASKIWLVCGHDAVRHVLRDPAFPVMQTGANIAALGARAKREFPALDDVLQVVPFVLNPPAHAPVRRFAAGILTARSLAQYVPALREIAQQLLARARADGGFDAVRDFAGALPTLFMGRVLGVPEGDVPALLRCTEDVAKLFNRLLRLREYTELDRQVAEGLALFGALAAERRRAARDDAISRMVRELPDAEVASYCYMTFLVGSETTSALIGGALGLLLEHPALYDELRESAELLDATIEEALRCESPVQSVTRFALREASVGAARIAGGERLFVMLGAANRDPAAYAEPDRFDPRRAARAHLAFSEGAHACIGATLTRLEARVALEALLALPRLRRAGAARYSPYDWLRRARELPVEFA